MPDPTATHLPGTVNRPAVLDYVSDEDARAGRHRYAGEPIHLNDGDNRPLCEQLNARAGDPRPLGDAVLVASTVSPELATCTDCAEWRHA